MPETRDGTQYRWGHRPKKNYGPAKPTMSEFPKIVHGKVCNTAEEEAALIAAKGPDAPVPKPPPPPPKGQQAPQVIFAGENPLQATLNAANARIATLEAEIAKRDARIAELQASQPDPAPSPEVRNALAEPAAEQKMKDETEQKDPGAVEIPENWREAHHRTRMSLARQISGQQPTSAEDADATIQAEVDRRAVQ